MLLGSSLSATRLPGRGRPVCSQASRGSAPCGHPRRPSRSRSSVTGATTSCGTATSRLPEVSAVSRSRAPARLLQGSVGPASYDRRMVGRTLVAAPTVPSASTKPSLVTESGAAMPMVDWSSGRSSPRGDPLIRRSTGCGCGAATWMPQRTTHSYASRPFTTRPREAHALLKGVYVLHGGAAFAGPVTSAIGGMARFQRTTSRTSAMRSSACASTSSAVATSSSFLMRESMAGTTTRGCLMPGCSRRKSLRSWPGCWVPSLGTEPSPMDRAAPRMSGSPPSESSPSEPQPLSSGFGESGLGLIRHTG
jgi:hypothetical protein